MMSSRIFPLFLYVVCYFRASAVEVRYGYEDPSLNLVQNWSFEDDIQSDTDWEVVGAQYQIRPNAHTGEKCIRIFNRDTTPRFLGLKQKMKGVKANRSYYLSMFIKIIDQPVSTKQFQRVSLSASYRSSAGPSVRFSCGTFPGIRKSSRWRQLGGDFITTEDISELIFEIEIGDVGMRYEVDSVSLIELPSDPRWEEKADIQIEKHRMGNIVFAANVPKQLPYCKLKFKIRQVKRHFGIGSAIKAKKFVTADEFGNKYRTFFANTFQWAVYENAMKWKSTEGKEGVIKYNSIDEALTILDQYNITVRGHTVLWGVLESNPDWVQVLRGTDMKNAAYSRIDSIMDHYKGRLNQWDVNNENLHGKAYSAFTDDPNFNEKIYIRAAKRDPDVKKCLNDYQVLRTGDYTSALVDMAMELNIKTQLVDCLGLQSHLREVPISPEIIQTRLRILAGAGLDLTLTEISIHTSDDELRAMQLNVLLKMACANKNVNGVLFWQFSDVTGIAFEPSEWTMFSGLDFVPNQTGNKLYALLNAWTTNGEITPKKKNMKERVTAFHGAYEVDVFYKNKFVKTVKEFYLHPGESATFRIPLSFGDFSSVYDDDTTNCNPIKVDETDDRDPNHKNNGGVGFKRKYLWRKNAKLQKQSYARGINFATASI